MKKVLLLARVLVKIICVMLMMISCEDDTPEILPSVIQFSVNRQNVVEGEEATILLTLDRPARESGSVELTIETNAVYRQQFQTDPAINNNTIVLQISKGEKSASFKIATVDSDKYEGVRFILFQLNSPSDDFKLGDITAQTLIIGDDEGPSIAGFTVSLATLDEGNDDGILVDIPFSSPARGEGSLTVTIHPGTAVEGTNFTIDQQFTNDSLLFNVVKDTPGVSFRIFPANNDLYTGDYSLSFTIADVSGVVQEGDIANYTLVIRDDERDSRATFAVLSGAVAETDGAGIEIEVSLSSPVKGEGTIAIAFPSDKLVYGRDFTTLPEAIDDKITLDFSHDETSGSFKVFPGDDNLFQGDRTLRFSITQPSGVLRRGVDSVSYQLTFEDDEVPAVATFAASTATIDETNSKGMAVQILFSHPVPGTGRVVLDIEGPIDRFTTMPAMRSIYDYDSYTGYYSYYISLDVELHATSASFTILPRNDGSCNKFSDITFTMSEVEGAITKEGDPKLELIIVDDEDPVLITLAEKEGTLNEDDNAGEEILLNFSKPAVQDGTIWVHLNYYNQYYSDRYVTVPEMQDYSSYGVYAPLIVKPGDASAVFKIIPINDDVAKEDFSENFHLSYTGVTESNGQCVQLIDKTYTLKLVDDD